jgi:hypothetical protein
VEKLFNINFFKALFRTHGFPNAPLSFLNAGVIELNNIGELKKVFKWNLDAITQDPSIFHFEYIEDANERRIRDAEVLGTACRNVNKGVILEIGTSSGHSTALMSENAPQAKIYTVNILPEEILKGEGGKHTTIALEKENIGSYYRQKGYENITQIFANTATWQPDIGTIDIAYIDGCHDTDFVFNDSKKILKHMKPGSFMLWHDFNLNLVKKFHWINQVCLGVERLYKSGLLKDRIFHVKDSWIGVYRLPF